MRSDFYRQEKGLLRRPPNVSKWHISWSLDNILEGFKEFHRVYQRWPLGEDMDNCEYLPNVKTIDRKFGGLRKVRAMLGLSPENFDYRTGQHRAKIMSEIWPRGYGAEQELCSALVSRYHEPYVHNQSRVVIQDKRWVKVDFLVYHQTGKFAVDIFYPKRDKRHYANNIAGKYRTYVDFPFTIYLVVANAKVSEADLQHNENVALRKRNPKAKLVSLSRFLDSLGEYKPLDDPYS